MEAETEGRVHSSEINDVQKVSQNDVQKGSQTDLKRIGFYTVKECRKKTAMNTKLLCSLYKNDLVTVYLFTRSVCSTASLLHIQG